MQNTTNTSAGFGPFHKVGLSFGSAGALVRLTEDDRIMAVMGAWVRTRRGPIDKVFVTRPEQLLGAPESLVECITLEGDAQRKRYDVVLKPEDRICGMVEGYTAGGSYAVVYMDRVGQAADFRSLMYRLDASWRLDVRSSKAVGTLSKWLHEDFLAASRDMPSAWPIMYASAALFGGQDPAEMDALFAAPDALPPQLPSDLAEACDAERRFRASQRRARALSPAQAEEFRQKLNPDQVAAFDALVAGKRTHV